MYTIALVFLVSILSTCLVVRYRFIHEGISGDHDVSGIQKFHSSPVPRIGGLCIFLSVLIGICVQWLQNESTDQLMRNSLTAPYLWGLCLLSVIPAVIFWRDPLVMLLFTLLFIVTYIAVYRKLVKFSSQRWMTLHEKKAK